MKVAVASVVRVVRLVTVLAKLTDPVIVWSFAVPVTVLAKLIVSSTPVVMLVSPETVVTPKLAEEAVISPDNDVVPRLTVAAVRVPVIFVVPAECVILYFEVPLSNLKSLLPLNETVPSV